MTHYICEHGNKEGCKFCIPASNPMVYRTKLEAYEAGVAHTKKEYEELIEGLIPIWIKSGALKERARAKKKLNPLYNRSVALKERVDREAEAWIQLDEFDEQKDIILKGERWEATGNYGIGLGKTKPLTLWQRLTRPIIRELKGFFRP